MPQHGVMTISSTPRGITPGCQTVTTAGTTLTSPLTGSTCTIGLLVVITLHAQPRGTLRTMAVTQTASSSTTTASADRTATPSRSKRTAIVVFAMLVLSVCALLFITRPKPRGPKPRVAPAVQTEAKTASQEEWQPVAGTSAKPPESHMEAKNRMYAEVEAERLRQEDEKLSKVDWDMARPAPAGPQPLMQGKVERSMSGEEKAVQSERLVLLLNRRVSRLAKRIEQAEKEGDTAKVERQKKVLTRLQNRVTELESAAVAQRAAGKQPAPSNVEGSADPAEGDQHADDHPSGLSDEDSDLLKEE